jgi:hypothetical protein
LVCVLSAPVLTRRPGTNHLHHAIGHLFAWILGGFLYEAAILAKFSFGAAVAMAFVPPVIGLIAETITTAVKGAAPWRCARCRSETEDEPPRRMAITEADLMD